MRISIRAYVEDDQSQPGEAINIGVDKRRSNHDPASGLGVLLGEAKEVLRQLQALLLSREVVH